MTRMNWDRKRKLFVRDSPKKYGHSQTITLEEYRERERGAAIAADTAQFAFSATGPWRFETVEERNAWLASRKKR